MASAGLRSVMCSSSIKRITVVGHAFKDVSWHGSRFHRQLHSSCRGHMYWQRHRALSDTCQLHWVTIARFKSSDTNSSVPYIPDPPPVPTLESEVSAISETFTTLGERSLESLGLGGWTPIGILQTGLEWLHVSIDLPWFLAIAAGTCVVRIIMFPLVILAQRNAAKMNNNLPQMQIIQMKMAEARKNGDALLAGKYAYELMTFMKEKELSPLKNFIVPLMQAPVFISFFMGIRQMANLPVESMKVGGMYWFTNLTVPDPFYILPMITSATLFITLELGIEGGIRAGNMQMMRYVFRAMPIVLFPFMINFPAGMLCYWATSNFLSLIQVAILRIPPVRDFFKIERLVHHPTDVLPITRKGFVESFKDTMTNAKIAREMQDRERVDEIRFRKAGLGPIQKTYPYDPTKQKPTTTHPSNRTMVDAKPRDRS